MCYGFDRMEVEIMRWFKWTVILTVFVLSFAVALAPPASAQQDPSGAIVWSLRASGLPVTDITPLTPETDGNHLLGRPGQYRAKTDWRDARVTTGSFPGIQTGGTVEVFSTEQERISRQAYIEAIAQSPLFAEYTYGHGLALLRVSRQLTPAQAAEYEAAMTAIMAG